MQLHLFILLCFTLIAWTHAATCYGVDGADYGVCGGHGDCNDDTNLCSCHAGYGGDECEEFTCFDQQPDDPDVCGGRGVCVAMDVCACDSYHSGDQCGEFEGSVEAGNAISFITRKSGMVLAFGRSEDGVLGLGEDVTDEQLVPVETSLSNVTHMSTFEEHVLVATKEGKVFVFGYGDPETFGLGGSDDTVWEPTQIDVLDDKFIVYVAAAGGYFSLVVSTEGKVYSFGKGGNGRLGRPETDRGVPTALEGDLVGVFVKRIAAGDQYSLVLGSNGRVYSFGNGGHGRLGHGDVTNQEAPKRIDSVAGIIAISAGSYHGLLLGNNGRVYSFGTHHDGELGLGDLADPVRVPTLIEALNNVNIVQVAAGDSYSAVLSDSGRVYTFGHGYSGQLGHGDTEDQLVPLMIPDLLNIRAIAAAFTHTLFVTKQGSLFSVGENYAGQTGLGTADGNTLTAKHVLCGDDCCFDVFESDDSVCNGHGDCEGTNDCSCETGYHGDECNIWNCFGKEVDDPDVCGGHGICGSIDQCFCDSHHSGDECETFEGSVEGGGGSSFIVRKSGKVLGFGYTSEGNLGLGEDTTDNQLVPTTIPFPQQNIVQISSFQDHALALTNQGKVFVFGYSDYPETFGLNTSVDTVWEPTQIDLLDDQSIVNVAVAGDYYSLAASREGKVYSWGYAEYGQLGRPDVQSGIPTAIEGVLTDVIIKRISAGYSHTLLLSSRGRVYSFGYDAKLGHGNDDDLDAPKMIESVKEIQAIATGDAHSLLLGMNGRVYSFGSNNQGQLGHGGWDVLSAPKLIEALEDIKIVQIAGGGDASFALTDAGRVYSWGSNGYGALGHDDAQSRVLPKLIEDFYNVRSFAGSVRFALFVTVHGNVYSTGTNDYGQTGLGVEDGTTRVPTLVVCGEGRGGDDCEPICFDVFASNETVCGGKGNCTDVDQCECGPGYAGDQCKQWSCSGIDKDDADVCSGNGACAQPDSCECNANYDGDQCEQWSCHGTDKDDEGVCNGHGECVDHNDCNCASGYTGDECDVPICFAVASGDANVCSGHGDCIRPDRCSCANTHYGLKCGQSIEEPFDDSSYRDNLEALNNAADISDATRFFFSNHRVCRSDACQSENTYVEFALRRLQDKVVDQDEQLGITETIDFVNDLSNSSFSLTNEARSSVITILEKETCERQQATSVKNHVSKYFNAVHDLKFGALKGMKLLRCLATTLRRNDQGENMDVTATKGATMRLTSEKNIEMNSFSIRADSFDNDLFVIESEDDDFGSVLEISGIDQDGTILETKDLEDLVSFQIQTNESQWISNYSCLYYDEDEAEWQTDGLTLNENDNGFRTNVTCQTSHFTLFRIELNYGDSESELLSKSSTRFEWWIGLLIAIAVIVFFAVLIAIAVIALKIVVLKLKAKRNKFKTVDIEMNEIAKSET